MAVRDGKVCCQPGQARGSGGPACKQDGDKPVQRNCASHACMREFQSKLGTAAALTLSLGRLAPGPHLGLRLQRLCKSRRARGEAGLLVRLGLHGQVTHKWQAALPVDGAGSLPATCCTARMAAWPAPQRALLPRTLRQGSRLTVLGLFGEVLGCLLHHLLGACLWWVGAARGCDARSSGGARQVLQGWQRAQTGNSSARGCCDNWQSAPASWPTMGSLLMVLCRDVVCRW